MRYPRRAGWMAVAGPAANALLVVIAIIVIKVGLFTGLFYAPDRISFGHLVATDGAGMWPGIAAFISILLSMNLLLAVLNLCAEHDEPMPPAAAAFVAREICNALAYAHEYTDDDGRPTPIIHRDVSPHNVMLGDDGRVKLVDFGVAKANIEGREQTRSGVVKGKLAYLAPEQLDNVRASPVTDIFAAGIVLYEMLANERLFVGDSDFNTLLRLKTMRVPPPSTHNPRVPPVLDLIALTALARHYGLLPAADPAWAIKPRIRHWGVEGYRPTIDGGSDLARNQR